MSTTAFAQFYTAAGFDVVQSEGTTWYAQSRQIYRSLPVDRPIVPTRELADEVLRRSGAFGLEFTTDQGRGFPSGHFVQRDRGYGLHSLQRQFRQKVHRGLRCCEVRELDFDELHRLGREASLDSMARQKRRVPHLVDPVRWRRFCDAGRESPAAGVFGSFVDGTLAAWLVYLVQEGTCYGLLTMSTNELRDRGANNVLLYVFSSEMIRREAIHATSLGIQSHPPAPRRDAFKRHLGYVAEPCELGMAFRPWVSRALLLGRSSEIALDLAARLSARRFDPGRVRAVLATARATSDLPRRGSSDAARR